MKIIIDNQEIDKKFLEKWQRKHAQQAFKTLKLAFDNNLSTPELLTRLTEEKLQLSYLEMLKKLGGQLSLADFGMAVLSTLSGKRRKIAEITLRAKGIDTQSLGEMMDLVMLDNSLETRRLNLSVCPEHYVLQPHGDTLEVIEKPGNSPVITRFFITFGEETGMITTADSQYSYQIVGLARLKKGQIVGGIRHQFRDVDDGIEAKLVVEFPALCPNFLVREHQKHLAVEWSGWIEWMVKQNVTR